MDRYVGKFHPESSGAMNDWKKCRFDPQAGEGPVCLDGSPFTVLTGSCRALLTTQPQRPHPSVNARN